MGTDLFLRPLFDWRGAIASPFGPDNPTTRHVLHALSLHMSTQGDSCFPKIDRLIAETGLSKRAVLQHLKLAADAGWLGKQELSTGQGKAWRRIEYYAQIPDGVEQQVVAWRNQKRNPLWPNDEAGASGAPRKGGASGAQGGARGALPNIKEVLNKNLLGDGVTRYTPEFETAFKSYPQRAGNNPKNDAWKAYKARLKAGVTDAQLLAGAERYAAWCAATGKTDTEYVMRASTFWGTGMAFEQAWPITDDIAQAPKAEPRCIHIPEGQGASARCMDAGDVGVGVIQIAGRQVAIRLCHRHYLPPAMAAGNLVTHPEVISAVKRFEQFATDRLVPA